MTQQAPWKNVGLPPDAGRAPVNPAPAVRRFEEALRSMERAVRSVRATLPEEEAPAPAPPAAPADAPPSDPASVANDDRTALELDVEAMRAAIHGLNQTVSQLAERARRSGDETAGRINMLARAAEALGSRIAAGNKDFDERLRSAEARLDGVGRVEGAISGLSAQFAGFDRLEEAIGALERSDAEGAARHSALAERLGSVETAAESMRSDSEKIAARLAQTEAALPRVEEAVHALEARGADLVALDERLSALTGRIAALDDVEKSLTALQEKGTAIEERIGGIEGALARHEQETSTAARRLQSAEETLAALPALEGKLAAFDEAVNARLAEIGQTFAAAAARADDVAGRVQALEQLPANRGDLDVAAAVRRVAALDELEKTLSSVQERHDENAGAIGTLQGSIRALAEETQALRGILAAVEHRLAATESSLSGTFRRDEALSAISGLAELIAAARKKEQDRTARQQAWLEQKLAEIERKAEDTGRSAQPQTEFAESLARLEQSVAATESRLADTVARNAGAAETRFAGLAAQVAGAEQRSAALHEDVRLRLAALEEKFARAQSVAPAPAENRQEATPASAAPAEAAAASPEMPPLVSEPAASESPADLLPPKIEPAAPSAVSQPLANPEPHVPARLAYLEKLRGAARASAEQNLIAEKKGLLGGKYGLHLRLGGGFVLVALLAVIAYAFAFHGAGHQQIGPVVRHGRSVASQALTSAPRAAPPASRDPSALPPDLAVLALHAGKGDGAAMLRLGLAYAAGDGVPRDDANAAAWLGRAANAGQPVAQYLLGLRFERGIGVPKDPAQAFKWFLAAAEHGNRKAMLNLGDILANGTGTQKNLAEALRWFQSAANLGLRDAQFNLAVMYERGFGTKASLGEAYKWYSIAAASGDEESKSRADALATQIPATDKAAADRSVAAFAPLPLNVSANVVP